MVRRRGDLLLGSGSSTDPAGPDETILLISAADGVDALVLRTTGALGSRRQPDPVAGGSCGRRASGGLSHLTCRGADCWIWNRRAAPNRTVCRATVGPGRLLEVRSERKPLHRM